MDGEHGTLMLKFGRRFLLTGGDCPHHTWHDEFIRDEQEDTGVLSIVTGKERPSLWMDPGLHVTRHYGPDVERKLTHLLKIRPVGIPGKN